MNIILNLFRIIIRTRIIIFLFIILIGLDIMMFLYYPKNQFDQDVQSIKKTFAENSNLINEIIAENSGSDEISTDLIFSFLRLIPDLQYLVITGVGQDKVYPTNFLEIENISVLPLDAINSINGQPVFCFRFTPELKFVDSSITYFIGLKADRMLERQRQNYKDAIIVFVASILFFWILVFLYFLDIYRPLFKMISGTTIHRHNSKPLNELVLDEKGIVQLKSNLVTRKTELKSINNILAATMKSQRNFIKVISHDLKAPLRNVSGLVDSIFRKYADSLNQDIVSRLTRIKNNVDKEREMITDILRNITGQKKILTYEKVDPNEIVQSILEDLAYEIQTKNIDVKIKSELPSVYSSRIILKHVFQNLIDNACKYFNGTENNQIEIDCKDSATEHLFSIKDTGPGIPIEFQNTLFHTSGYSQPLNSLENPEGGLGLQLVSTFIDIINGKIWLESEIGEGSTFFISLNKLDAPKAGIF